MVNIMEKLIVGLPKGSLQEATYTLFKKAGFNISGGSRSYFPSVDDEDLEMRLLRPQEMSRYVEQGMLDAGAQEGPGLVVARELPGIHCYWGSLYAGAAMLRLSIRQPARALGAASGRHARISVRQNVEQTDKS